MMGVMQWMCIEDCCFLLSKILEKKGSYLIKGQADILKSEGTSVSEVKGFTVQIYEESDQFIAQAEVIKTDKVVFRDTVKPGETLFISLSSIELIDL